MRADALQNRDLLIATAAAAFGEPDGASITLKDIAGRAGVGIGTLYRNFPNRQALLEAVYVGEVERLNASVSDFVDLEPWDALAGWLQRFVAYMATKQALAAELLDYVDRDAPLFRSCRKSFQAAGEPLLARAQEAGVVRPDVDLNGVLQLVGGIAKIQGADSEQIEHLLSIALDGLRFRPSR
jgi:AcrR family transcriptional regulator